MTPGINAPVTAVIAFGILALHQRGYRRFELAITALLGIVSLGFAYNLVAAHAAPASMAGRLRPAPAGRAACCWPPASSAPP